MLGHLQPSPRPAPRASGRRFRRRPSSIGGLLGLLALALAAGPIAAATDDSNPFAIRLHEVRGRIVQVWPLRVGSCGDDSGDLLILSSEGGPPAQKRFATWLPCGSALVPGDPRIRIRPIDDAAVIVDVAAVPGRSGPQLLSVSAAGIRIEALDGPANPVERTIPGGLPLPPRPWEIARLPLVEAWNDDGKPLALVPALTGAWLVDLASGEARRLELPIYADYQTFMPFLPETVGRWLVQEVSWPALARGDDNGDGRRDLFALSRWGVWIYHAGPEGLPSTPSRRLDYVPFDEKTERRHEASATNYFARDLDGDTRADLILNTIQGGVMDGRSTTRIHLNRGDGVRIEGAPTALRETRGGFAGVDFVDLEGDGVVELLETSFEFGVLQLVKLLVSQRADTKVRILALDRTTPGGLRTLFEDHLSFGLDFKEGRFADLVPGLGDWNGDGLLDLFVPRGDGAIGFRLGSRAPGAPRLGSLVGRQPVPLASGASRIADLDGDGLDEIVVYSTAEPETPLVVLENLGRLPGSKSSLRPR